MQCKMIFYGGGTLVLAKDGLLTVNGTLSGVTEFQTSGGVNSSGIAEYDRLYIRHQRVTEVLLSIRMPLNLI